MHFKGYENKKGKQFIWYPNMEAQMEYGQTTIKTRR
jgi:hypothetical protein